MSHGGLPEIIASAALGDLPLRVPETGQGGSGGDRSTRYDGNPSTVRCCVERVPVAQGSASAGRARGNGGVGHGASTVADVTASRGAAVGRERDTAAERSNGSSVSMFVSTPAYDGDGGYMDVEGTASPPDRLASDISLITDTGFRQESEVSLITDFGGGHSSTAVASAPKGRRASVSLRQISEL